MPFFVFVILVSNTVRYIDRNARLTGFYHLATERRDDWRSI